MQYFLFVPTESGQPEMAALTALDAEAAVAEAELREFGGRIGYLFEGDLFLREVKTVARLTTAEPLSAPAKSGTMAFAPPRLG